MTSGTAARRRSRVPWRPFARGRDWRGRRGEGRVRVASAVAVEVIAVAVEVIAVEVTAVTVEVTAVTVTVTAVTAIVEVPVAVGAVIITEVIVIDTIFVCFTLYQLSLVLLYR